MIDDIDTDLKDYRDEHPCLIHLTVTGRCYARCEGCINRYFSRITPPTQSGEAFCEDADPVRDVELILQLAERMEAPKITICFYGGEPFLALEEMHQI